MRAFWIGLGALLVLLTAFLIHLRSGALERPPPVEPEQAAPVPPGERGPDTLLGLSWGLIDRWSSLNDRCARFHDDLAKRGDAVPAEKAAARDATWDDLKSAHDAVMKVASTLEQGDVEKARELVQTSEQYLERADERLAAAGY